MLIRPIQQMWLMVTTHSTLYVLTSASLAYDFNWTDDLGGMAKLDVSHADGFDVYLRTFPAQPVLETDPLTYLNFRVGAVTERWR